MQADVALYVVDSRQGLHFKNVYEAARRWGYDKVSLEHIAFGSVLGKDGKPIKTREGEAVTLEALLDEAVTRAGQVFDIKAGAEDSDPEPDNIPLDRATISEAVGLGA